MEKLELLTRKSFIRIFAGLGTGFFLVTWYRLSDYQARRENQEEYRHGGDIPLGVSYFGKFYLFRKDESVIAFSTVCTHAGCRIGKTNSDILRCGCHGSRFDAATGNPVNGPAILPLQKLDCRFDPKTGEWVVKLQPHKESNV